ncbi:MULTISPECIES: transcription antitermination protein NusB [unclassified Mycoplasma]|uniref:transcription antitermination protein NusB n=1 Tax=unclassified Mycoplasma TaxID=2683645 RepID=UPI002B1CFEDB|nr:MULTISPECIES: transcription antitermination protein NusB [unclassified Mycoplasma]MEA4162436.1 transcription antitermination protein NusB [Mycoplasma sp. 4404]MEA4276232.1 transcription antitermination protein NusB [Mycoplasma sp. 21DD0573]
MSNKKSRREIRLNVIQVLYKYELLNEAIDVPTAVTEFDFVDIEETKRLSLIASNYKFLRKTLSSLLNSDWSWERLSPVVRAIILNGAFELFNNQPKIVFNESVEITKMFFPPALDQSNVTQEESYYKFVNGILENYYKLIQLMDKAK